MPPKDNALVWLEVSWDPRGAMGRRSHSVAVCRPAGKARDRGRPYQGCRWGEGLSARLYTSCHESEIAESPGPGAYTALDHTALDHTALDYTAHVVFRFWRRCGGL